MRIYKGAEGHIQCIVSSKDVSFPNIDVDRSHLFRLFREAEMLVVCVGLQAFSNVSLRVDHFAAFGDWREQARVYDLFLNLAVQSNAGT